MLLRGSDRVCVWYEAGDANDANRSAAWQVNQAVLLRCSRRRCCCCSPSFFSACDSRIQASVSRRLYLEASLPVHYTAAPRRPFTVVPAAAQTSHLAIWGGAPSLRRKQSRWWICSVRLCGQKSQPRNFFFFLIFTVRQEERWCLPNKDCRLNCVIPFFLCFFFVFSL